MLKRLTRRRSVRAAAGRMLAEYLKLVHGTTRFVMEPEHPYDHVGDHLPAILTAWHGHHFLGPLMRRPDHRVAVLVSRSFDGEVNAAAVEALGVQVIRGSGGRNPLLWVEKGGVTAFNDMMKALAEGVSVAQTADIPGGEPRRCGLGIVKLAQHSGRPIVPVASVTRRNVRFNTRDQMRLPLPFGRGAFVVEWPIYVPRDVDIADIEAIRGEVDAALNRAQQRADELAHGPGR